MTRLNLSPLPSLRSDGDSRGTVSSKDGFVDDSVVMALVAGPSIHRGISDQSDLALAADHLDFAGWCLSHSSPVPVSAPRRPVPSDCAITRPTPPVSDEPGLGEPHRGHHRWWLAGLAGAVSTMLFSVLLISLSARYSMRPDDHVFVETLASPKPVAPAEKVVPGRPAPQLTEVAP